MHNKTSHPVGKKNTYHGITFRSLYERDIWKDSVKKKKNVAMTYESLRIPWTHQVRYYKPDFILEGKSKTIIVEAKGRFMPQDRTKHLRVKEQNPELDIRFVFMTDGKINKNSVVRYSDWCIRYGFKYAIGFIPMEWFEELRV